MEIEYTFAHLPDEIVQLILVLLPKTNFMQYSVICKLWHRISNSVGFWKQSCLDLLGHEISIAKWTPQLIDALEKAQIGPHNLLVPTIKGENSFFLVDWRRYYYIMSRFNEIVSIRKHLDQHFYKELTLDVCKQYLRKAATGVNDEVAEFLLLCDLFVLLLKRNLKREAKLNFQKLQKLAKRLLKYPNNGLLVGVKLQQTMSGGASARKYNKELLKIAVQAFKQLNTLGRTSRRLFRGLCCNIIALDSKPRKLDFGKLYKYQMIPASSKLLFYPELDQELLDVVWHYYFNESDVKIKACALAAFFISSSFRQIFGEEMLKIALNASTHYDPTLKRNAAVIIYSICETNKVAMVCIPDATFVNVVEKLIEYLRTPSMYSFTHVLRALGSLPPNRTWLIGKQLFAEMNQTLVEIHWPLDDLNELPRLGLAFSQLFKETLSIYSYGDNLSYNSVLENTVAYIELGKNALREEFDGDIKHIITSVLNGSYLNLNVVDFIVKVQDHILRLFVDDHETFSQILSILLNEFPGTADAVVANYIMVHKLGSDAVMNRSLVKELPYSMNQYIERLEAQLDHKTVPTKYFEEEEKIQLDESRSDYIIEPLSRLEYKPCDLELLKAEAMINSPALHALIYFKPALKDFFKQHAQQILHLLLAELFLVESTAANMNTILTLLQELKSHLDPLDLQQYICLLVGYIRTNTLPLGVASKTDLTFAFCIKQCMQLFKESSKPHVGTLRSLLKYFLDNTNSTATSSVFPDLNAVLDYLDSICRKWPRIAYAAFCGLNEYFFSARKDSVNEKLLTAHFHKLTAVCVSYFGVLSLPIESGLDKRISSYLEIYRNIPEKCVEARKIFQRAIYLTSAAYVDIQLYRLTLFNFSEFTKEQIVQAVTNPTYLWDNFELNLLAKQMVLSLEYDEKCLFQQHGIPELRLFFGALQTE